MSSSTIICLLSILAIIPFQASANSSINLDPFRNHYTVHVINGFSNNDQPMLIHCWSRNDDLGHHTLYIGGDLTSGLASGLYLPLPIFTVTSNGVKNISLKLLCLMRMRCWVCATRHKNVIGGAKKTDCFSVMIARLGKSCICGIKAKERW
ncbi:putative plant self-incompatibility S1 family protein [Turnera subulata]|nr:putative plant self-incompatibility S1 family protein [Turnera subulata]